METGKIISVRGGVRAHRAKVAGVTVRGGRVRLFRMGDRLGTGCPLDETPWSVDVLLIDCTGPGGPRPMSRLRRPLLPVTG